MTFEKNRDVRGWNEMLIFHAFQVQIDSIYFLNLKTIKSVNNLNPFPGNYVVVEQFC